MIYNTRPEDQKAKRPKGQKATRPQDHKTKRPQDHMTTWQQENLLVLVGYWNNFTKRQQDSPQEFSI